MFKTLLCRFKGNKYVLKVMNENTLNQFGKYFLTGIMAFILEFSLFRILSHYVLNWLLQSGSLSHSQKDTWIIISNSISMFSGFILSFLINRSWSFKSQDNAIKQMLLTGILFLINLGISDLVIYCLTAKLLLLPIAAKLITMTFIVMWNFVIYKKIIYRK